MFVLVVVFFIFVLFFWLMPILSRLISKGFSFIDFESTMKFSWSDVIIWSRIERDRYSYECHWIPLLRIKTVIYSDLVGLSHLIVND